MPIDDYPPEKWEEYWAFITERGRKTSDLINIREIARYEQTETLTGQVWYGANNQVKQYGWRRVYPFGAIAPGATLAVPHGLTGVSRYTHINGTAVTATDSRPVPNTSVVAANQGVAINVGAANISITNGAAAPAITSGVVVLEYLK